MSALYTSLKKYVGHAKQLAKTTNYKRSLAFLTPLDAVSLALKDVNAKNDKAVAGIIFQYQTQLSKILPHPANPSYRSSYETLERLKAEAAKKKLQTP